MVEPDITNIEVTRELKKELSMAKSEIEKLEKQIMDLHKDLNDQSRTISALKAEIRMTMTLMIIVITGLIVHGILK